VKANPYVSLDRVPRGREFQVAVVVNIASGFHMNSHKPTDAYLIATTLTPALPAGITLTDTVYPAGRLEKFAFSPNEPLDVYTGGVTLRMKLIAQATAALGRATIPMMLRYQACNQTTCLPPVKVPVSVEVAVAEAGAASHAVHSEIFSAAGTASK
jgi:Disulphide bond corrector protein DsbC